LEAVVNSKDRLKIARIRNALESVPYANDGYGSKTASIAGFVAFHKDMKVVKKACENALFFIACPDPSKTKAEQDAEFEEAIQIAEDWIGQRKLTDWQSYSTSVSLQK
jgi:hypothetical protein